MENTNINATLLPRIKKDFGKTFSALKPVLKEGEWLEGNGYTLFYTSNNNFQNGAKNGGGKGYFVRINLVGMVREIKIA